VTLTIPVRSREPSYPPRIGTRETQETKIASGEIPLLHSGARLHHGPRIPETHMQQLDSLPPDRARNTRHPTARCAKRAAVDAFPPADMLRDHASGPARDGLPSSDSDGPRVYTHWTRILYCDVLTTRTDVSIPATKVSTRNAGFDDGRSAIEVAVLLFAIVVALCLAVVNVFVSPEVGAAALDSSRIPAASDTRAGPPTPSPGVRPCPQ
jgi:hypothetical protein